MLWGLWGCNDHWDRQTVVSVSSAVSAKSSSSHRPAHWASMTLPAIYHFTENNAVIGIWTWLLISTATRPFTHGGNLRLCLPRDWYQFLKHPHVRIQSTMRKSLNIHNEWNLWLWFFQTFHFISCSHPQQGPIHPVQWPQAGGTMRTLRKATIQSLPNRE